MVLSRRASTQPVPSMAWPFGFGVSLDSERVLSATSHSESPSLALRCKVFGHSSLQTGVLDIGSRCEHIHVSQCEKPSSTMPWAAGFEKAQVEFKLAKCVCHSGKFSLLCADTHVNAIRGVRVVYVRGLVWTFLCLHRLRFRYR